MINLSKKAASRFHIQWKDLSEQNNDFWKVDIFMIGRIPMMLIVHEYTLFTLVRRKSDFKSIEDISNEIIKCCPWYRYVGELSIGKNLNRHINGSINEMKICFLYQYSPEQINAMEMMINDVLFSYLSPKKGGYGKPYKAVDLYTKGLWP